ncbi:ABC transporter permease subunit [Roseomonas nepalensis]|uniref:sn-glycerol-3-phosphate transport system permease protein UgpE n=1 Tax=Muricoccus nepalensis TaxID=1854500 RepID=A0A502G9U3_9PROT|nr:ABC transporter permease subunit [Roseomonas nepalensis]TPG57796.1 ABC transporter permease subunit [Roseomonas nepalensis]
MIERASWLDAACHAILVVAALLTCLPLYYALVAGSLTTAEVQQVPLPFLPGGAFVENARAVWTRIGLGRLLLNSVIVALGIAVGKLAISLLSAFAITYFRFRFRGTVFWLIFLSLMLPVEVRIVPTFEAMTDVLMPLRLLVQLSGVDSLVQAMTGWRLEVSANWSLLNSYSGLIFPLMASATATFLFRQFFLTIPDELCDAARIDGASPMRFFWTILLPMSRPNLAALGIIFFLFGWNQYLWPLLFTTEPTMTTVVVGIKQLVPHGDSIPAWNLTMNAALLAMLPPIVVVLLLQRWFVKGLIESGK